MPRWTREMLIALADEVCARADAAYDAELAARRGPEQCELPLGPGGNIVPFAPRAAARGKVVSVLGMKSV